MWIIVRRIVILQYQCMPSWHGIFQFGTFLSELKCILTLNPSSSPNSFHILLIHTAFLLSYLRSYILPKICFASLTSGYWSVFAHSYPFTGRFLFFRCFGMPCFLFLLFYPISIFFLVFLLSPAPSALFLWVVSSVLLVLLFPFSPYMFQHSASVLS